jgi:hypothetical protein
MKENFSTLNARQEMRDVRNARGRFPKFDEDKSLVLLRHLLQAGEREGFICYMSRDIISIL